MTSRRDATAHGPSACAESLWSALGGIAWLSVLVQLVSFVSAVHRLPYRAAGMYSRVRISDKRRGREHRWNRASPG